MQWEWSVVLAGHAPNEKWQPAPLLNFPHQFVSTPLIDIYFMGSISNSTFKPNAMMVGFSLCFDGEWEPPPLSKSVGSFFAFPLYLVYLKAILGKFLGTDSLYEVPHASVAPNKPQCYPSTTKWICRKERRLTRPHRFPCRIIDGVQKLGRHSFIGFIH